MLFRSISSSAKDAIELARQPANPAMLRSALGEYVWGNDPERDDLDAPGQAPEKCSSSRKTRRSPAPARNETRRRYRLTSRRHNPTGKCLGGISGLDQARPRWKKANRLIERQPVSHWQLGIVEQAQGKSARSGGVLEEGGRALAPSLAGSWPLAALTSDRQRSDGGRALDAVQRWSLRTSGPIGGRRCRSP